MCNEIFFSFKKNKKNKKKEEEEEREKVEIKIYHDLVFDKYIYH
jgi:hypothetical protein